MPSDSSYVRRLRLSESLRYRGQSASSPCSFCCRNSLRCVGMPEKSLKCAECTKRGRPCVDVAWKVDFVEMERVRKEWREAQRQSAKAQARAASLWEKLEELNKRADEEAECLARVIEEEDRSSVLPPSQSSGSAPVPAVVPSNAEALALFEAGAFNESVFSDPLDLDAFLRNPVSANGTSVGG
jgi:hypothetical protein